MNPLVGTLSLYDVANVKGVAADVSHVNTKAQTKVCIADDHRAAPPGIQENGTFSLQGYEGPDELADALKGCDLVIIPAGIPRKPGMTRDDLFKVKSRNWMLAGAKFYTASSNLPRLCAYRSMLVSSRA